jgi:hypothetical protein
LLAPTASAAIAMPDQQVGVALEQHAVGEVRIASSALQTTYFRADTLCAAVRHDAAGNAAPPRHAAEPTCCCVARAWSPAPLQPAPGHRRERVIEAARAKLRRWALSPELGNLLGGPRQSAGAAPSSSRHREARIHPSACTGP